MKTVAQQWNREKPGRAPANPAANRRRAGTGTLDFADQRETAVSQASLQAKMDNHQPYSGRETFQAMRPKENETGLPDRLKSGIESLSGLALDDVRVHYNSSRPAALQALAYTQGTDIHIGPGQERHLPHEAWHVIQQKQGRVQATRQLRGIALNDDSSLEMEASRMGARAYRMNATAPQNNREESPRQDFAAVPGKTVQRLVGFEFECNGCALWPAEDEGHAQKDKVLVDGETWKLTAEVVPGENLRCVEFKTRAIDDQTPPETLWQIMAGLLGAAQALADNKEGITIQELGRMVKADYADEFKNTNITANIYDYTAHPQITGGVNFERILSLLHDLVRQGDVPQSELMTISKKKSTKLQGMEKSLQNIELKLSNEPLAYQGFIALLATYIISAQSSSTPPKYFKSAVPLISRMDLAEFLRNEDIGARSERILNDLAEIVGPKSLETSMFPAGVFNDKKKVVDLGLTAADWVSGILKGADPIPWSLNVSQSGEPFQAEPTGPGKKGRPLGAPIEIRSIKDGISWKKWPELAIHLYSYVQMLNNWKTEPAPYESMTSMGSSLSDSLPVFDFKPGKFKKKSTKKVKKVEGLEPERTIELLHPLITDPAWNTLGKGIFGTFVPAGIKSMRTALTSSEDPENILFDLAAIADTRLQKSDKDRARATIWLYRIVKGIRKYSKEEDLASDIQDVDNLLRGMPWRGPWNPKQK